MQDREGGSLFMGAVVLQGAEDARCVLEAVLGEEAPHLEVRVRPGLQAAVELKHRLVAEGNRRVGLLPAHGIRTGVRKINRAEGEGAQPGQLAPRATKTV